MSAREETFFALVFKKSKILLSEKYLFWSVIFILSQYAEVNPQGSLVPATLQTAWRYMEL
jgi:hypothetical protein